METTLLTVGDDIRKEIAPVIAEGDALAKRIVDEASYAEGSAYLKRNKAAEKIVEDKLGPIRDDQHKAWKKTLDLIKELTGPIQAGSLLVSRAMTLWKQEDDQKKRVEQERLAAEAKKREEDARLAAAEVAEQSGQPHIADAILNDPTPVAAPPAPKPVKVDGTYQRTTYKARIFDFKALIRAVAAGEVPEDALMGNMPFLNGQARLGKGNLKYPGVEVVAETTTNVR